MSLRIVKIHQSIDSTVILNSMPTHCSVGHQQLSKRLDSEPKLKSPSPKQFLCSQTSVQSNMTVFYIEVPFSFIIVLRCFWQSANHVRNCWKSYSALIGSGPFEWTMYLQIVQFCILFPGGKIVWTRPNEKQNFFFLLRALLNRLEYLHAWNIVFDNRDLTKLRRRRQRQFQKAINRFLCHVAKK